MSNDMCLSICYQRFQGDTLKHHGVMGMKWGVRRYQPYGQGYNPQNVGKFQAAKGVKKASMHQQNINWRERNQAIKADRQLKNQGDITKEEFRARKKQHNKTLKEKNKYAKSSEFVKEALSGATSNTAEGVSGRYAKEAYKGDPNYSKKRGLQIANKIISANVAIGNIAGLLAAAPSAVAMMSMVGAPALAVPVLALSGGTLYGMRKLDTKIRNSIVNRVF